MTKTLKPFAYRRFFHLCITLLILVSICEVLSGCGNSKPNTDSVESTKNKTLRVSPATPSEVKVLRTVFKRAVERTSSTKSVADVHVVHLCVLRHEVAWEWASGATVIGDPAEGERGASAGTIVWFHRQNGRWKTLWPNSPPPQAIVRLLAPCVGYGANEYGG